MTATCPVCHARGDRPCVEAGRPIAGYHVARVRLESRHVVDHAGEAARLRAGGRS